MEKNNDQLDNNIQKSGNKIETSFNSQFNINNNYLISPLNQLNSAKNSTIRNNNNIKAINLFEYPNNNIYKNYEQNEQNDENIQDIQKLEKSVRNILI